MSYILDALKKSDKERQQGSSPHLHAVHGYPSAVNRTKISRRWWYSTLLTVILILFVGGWLVFQYLPEPKGVAKIRETAVTEAERPAQSVAESTQTNSVNSVQGVVVIKQDKQKLVISPSSSQPEAAVPVEVPLLADFPVDFQKQLTKMKFAGHTYSQEPSRRVIIINNRILKEGDRIDQDTFLREITWEGVVLEYKETEFRIDTNNR